MYMDSTKKDKIIGSLIGGAIGDSLGYEKEFTPKNKIITKFEGKERISSNTQMTLFTANGLIWRETRSAYKGISLLPPVALYYAYIDWLDTQTNEENGKNFCWIKNVPQLNVNRTPSDTCIESLYANKNKPKPSTNKHSKGCGAITRIAPLGLYYEKKFVIKFTEDICELTHCNPLAIIPSLIFATMINILVNTNTNIKNALDQAISECKEKCNGIDSQATDYFLKLVNISIKLSKLNISDKSSIDLLGVGYVAEETFAIAIYSCLKYPNSFKDAIICAINHEGNTNGTGSLTGNIMGAYLNYSNIPLDYIEKVELKDVILEIAQDLTESPPGYDDYDEKWYSKYVHNLVPEYLN